MMKKKTTSSKNISLAHKFLEYVTASWMAQAVYAAAELQIADLLADGPRTNEELAAATGTHAPSLRRLLRALATIEICRERKDGSFEITAMGSLLGTDTPGSLRSWTIWWGSNLWQNWGNLLYSVKTGKSARKLLTGMDNFNHLKQNPETATLFNQAMAELTQLISESVVRTYDFSGFKRIMDVGGGYGELLIRILKASPESSGILFDLPHALEGAKHRFKESGLASRCKFLEGDFFESVPTGADAYILKSVIHDWDDKKSKLILKKCRHAMTKEGRLLLIERILPGRLGITAADQELVRSDLTMLIANASQERTEPEFRNLFNSAGLRITRIIPAGMTFSIIEAVSN